jgi:hypothetical protein
MRLRYLFFILMLSVLAVSCTKDEDIKNSPMSLLKADSAKVLTATTSPANTLAVGGSLKIVLRDSAYTFDASTDSIAVVNLYLDSKKYFGITAINKEHTMSFGISAPGYAKAAVTDSIAGSQFLLNAAKSPNLEYTLSRNNNIPEQGKLIITEYSQDSVLAKGSFYTYLSKDIKSTSPFYKVTGTFSLKLK